MTDETKKIDHSSQEAEIIAADLNWSTQSFGSEILREAAKREHTKLSLLALAYGLRK